MGNLSVFFAENAIKPENVKISVSNRFLDEKGEPVEWELRPIMTAQDNAIRATSVKTAIKNGKEVTEFSSDKYLVALAAECVVYPDLNDKDLQNSYGVLGAENLLEAMLLPGETGELTAKALEINRFAKPMKEMVDEIKN